jgi:long-chain-fatty-acid--CoA ligase ACSBG
MEQNLSDSFRRISLLKSTMRLIIEWRLTVDRLVIVLWSCAEILITAGGENVPSVPIEDAVKERLPVVSNCMLIGDKRRYLTMLITIKVTIDSS